MVGEMDERNESTLVLVGQLVALLVAFAVPVVALSLIFPKHASSIVLVSVYVLFGLAALFAGAGWYEPTYSPSARTYTKLILFLTVVAMAMSKWTADPEQDVADWGFDVLIRGAILVLPFFVGRFVAKQLQGYSQLKSKD